MSPEMVTEAEFTNERGEFQAHKALLTTLGEVRALKAEIRDHGGVKTQLSDQERRLAELEKWRADVDSVNNVSLRHKARSVVDDGFKLVVGALLAYLLLGQGSCPAVGPAQSTFEPPAEIRAGDTVRAEATVGD